MGSRVKKPIYLSAEEKRRNAEYLEKIKTMFPKKTLKCSIVFSRDGSKQDYKSSGHFIDRNDAEEYAKSYLLELNKASKANVWKIESIECIERQEIQDNET